MKKLLVLMMTVTMLFVCSGCGSNNVDASAAEAVSSISPEEMEAQKANLQAILDAKEDGHFLTDLYEKANSWDKGNVTITMSIEINGYTSTTIIDLLDDKYRIYSDAVVEVYVTIDDGTTTYEINQNDATYSARASDSGAVDTIKTEYLLGADAEESFVSSGVEEAAGMPYIYEEYTVDGINLKFYFDENGDVQYVMQPVDGDELLFNYTVELSETANETIFELPSGYTEVFY